MAEASLLLERKLSQSSNLEDICYFLNTSDAKIPQSISLQFTAKFSQHLIRAIDCKNLSNTSILVNVLQHIVNQDLTASIQKLISSKMHSNFEMMINFFMSMVCDKGNPNSSQAVKPFVLLFSTIVSYCEKMHDHFNWLIQNMLHVILLILGEANASVHAKTQVGEIFLGIFEEEGSNAAACCRTFVEENEEDLDMLSKRALDGLAQTGHYELQELVIEIIIRMWKTEIRNRKALKWFEGHPRILAKFLAIVYDEFDYSVRMFLNEVNSSVHKRRIVTLQYDKLVIGEETYLPTNRWCNCADFCFASKVLEVRYPFHEDGSENEHKCKWNVAHVKADDLASFKIEDNKRSGTYDLHLNFQLPAYRVLQDFVLEDKVSRKMIVMICIQEKLTLAKLVMIANALFGVTRNLGHVSKSSVPKVNITGNHGAWMNVSRRTPAVDVSFFQLSQESARSSMQVQRDVLNFNSDPKSLEPEGDGAIPIDVEKNSNDDVGTSQAEPEAVKESHASESAPNAKVSVTPVLISAHVHRALRSDSDDNANQERPARPPKVSISRLTMTNSRCVVHTVGSDSDAIRGASSDEFADSKGKRTTTKNQSHKKALSIVTLDVVPETQQAAKNTKSKLNASVVSSVPADASADLMLLDYLAGEAGDNRHASEERAPSDKQTEAKTDSGEKTAEDVVDDKKSGGEVSDKGSGSGNEDIPSLRRVTRSQRRKQTQEPSEKPKKDQNTAKKNNRNNRTESKRGSSSTDKVNEEFEQLRRQFQDKENVDDGLKQSDTGKSKGKKLVRSTKKKRSLINAEVCQMFDVTASVEAEVEDAAIKSVPNRPIADKFAKTGKRNALRSLNVEPRQDLLVKDRTDEVVRKKTPRRKRKAAAPLPYEAFEEVPVIDTSATVVLPNIQTIRDAPRDEDVDYAKLFASTKLTAHQDEIVEANPRDGKKKKARVSFDPAAKTGSQNPTTSKRRSGKGRKKKTDLFDSMSEATSGDVSEPSWIQEQIDERKRTPKITKTYKRRKESAHKSIDTSFRASLSSSDDSDSPRNNNSIVSRLSLLECVGAAGHLSFDDIARSAEEEQPQLSKTVIAKPKTGSHGLSDTETGDWDRPNVMPIVDEGKSTDVNPGPKASDTIPDGNLTGKTAFGLLSKDFENIFDNTTIKLATTIHTEPAPSVVNNRTPTDGQDRYVFSKEISPPRKPSSDENELPAKKFFKSKKKLEMRVPETNARSSSSDMYTSSSGSDERSRRNGNPMKLMKSYVRRIDRLYGEGHSRRLSNGTKAMVSGQAKIQAGLEKCEKNMRELDSLQDKTLEFMDTMKSRVDDALRRTAKSILETKKAFKSSMTDVAEASRTDEEATNRLRRVISRDLKRMVEKVDRENVAASEACVKK